MTYFYLNKNNKITNTEGTQLVAFLCIKDNSKKQIKEKRNTFYPIESIRRRSTQKYTA